LAHVGDNAAATQAGLRALAIGEAHADVAIQVLANQYLGLAYVVRGACREGVRHSQAAIALIPEDLEQERFGQAQPPSSFARFMLASALGALGHFADAFDRLREAMHIAEEAGHVYSLLSPLFGLGSLKLDQGDFAGAVAPLERGLELCRTRQASSRLDDFAWALGAAYHRTGRRAEGVALMEEAARGFGERARWSGWPGRVGALGGAYLVEGRLADATRIAQQGLATARRRGERGLEGHVLQLLGDIAAHPDRVDLDTAEPHYRQALAMADELGLRPLAAHCHLGLGMLYRRAGAREEARQHLTTSATMFSEMDMRYWLEQSEMAVTTLA
jgi:tetratricopeptide (TPR) repeat protein